MFLQVTVLQIKECLEGQAEVRKKNIQPSYEVQVESCIRLTVNAPLPVSLQWDQGSMDVFKVLNECDPGQVAFYG